MNRLHVVHSQIGEGLMDNKREELIKQIESLQRFYFDIGINSENVRTIFVLTLAYLKGKVDKMVVKSFFDVLMNHNKLKTEREVNLLLCFEDLVDSNDIETEVVTIHSMKVA